MLRQKSQQGEKVSFSLNAPEAHKVMLAGDFNNWKCESTPLRKGKDNMWKKNLILRPGRYEYKFVVDGNWISDPNNSNRILNSLGTENSVVEVGVGKYK